MSNDQIRQESYEVYYHTNEYTRLFLFSTDSLAEAENLISKSHIDFSKTEISKVKLPYISITCKISEEKINEAFFCRIGN
jgi:hypothetical protein